MKNIFKLMILFLLVLPFQACSDDEEAVVTTLDVTPNNVSGIWKLSEWSGGNGQVPNLYIEFVRRDKTFKIYEDVGSMYYEVKTGTFEIEEDIYKGSLIKGKYDYGTGKWNNDYIVQSLTETVMVLVADGDGEVQTFVRVDEIPAEVMDRVLPTDKDEE